MINRKYIPANSTKETRDGIDAEVYLFTNPNPERPNPAAIGYKGKSQKPAFNHYYRNEEARAAYVDSFFAEAKRQQDNRAAHNAARKAARIEFTHGFKIGDIVYRSYGYDQTNIDFYQITRTTTKTATFRKIRQITSGRAPLGDSWQTLPDIGNFVTDAPEHTRPVKAPYNKGEKGEIPYASYSGGSVYNLRQWDGRPLYASDGH